MEGLVRWLNKKGVGIGSNEGRHDSFSLLILEHRQYLFLGYFKENMNGSKLKIKFALLLSKADYYLEMAMK